MYNWGQTCSLWALWQLKLLPLPCGAVLLSCACSTLSGVLLQPVLDPVTDSVMGVLCAFNKADVSDGRDIFYEPTFTPSDW